MRRERPIQGAQLRLWDHDGMRHQVRAHQPAPVDARRLELRHRRHGQVENRIKNLKDCGLERMPFTSFAANAAWMEMVLTAADLLAWASSLLLTGELAVAEPRTLRYRLLHIAGRLDPQRPTHLAAPPRALALDQRPARRLPASRRHHLNHPADPIHGTELDQRAPTGQSTAAAPRHRCSMTPSDTTATATTDKTTPPAIPTSSEPPPQAISCTIRARGTAWRSCPSHR